VVEEEVIDEEETDMAAYAENVSESGQYEELEEEVREQGLGVNSVLEEERLMAPEELAERVPNGAAAGRGVGGDSGRGGNSRRTVA